MFNWNRHIILNISFHLSQTITSIYIIKADSASMYNYYDWKKMWFITKSNYKRIIVKSGLYYNADDIYFGKCVFLCLITGFICHMV